MLFIKKIGQLFLGNTVIRILKY